MGNRLGGCIWQGLLLVALASSPPVLLGADGAQHIFIHEEAERGVLCGYIREDVWARIPKQQDPEFVAVTNSVRGILDSIVVQRDTEDTATYDEYKVDKEGRIRQLKRVLDVVPERLTREQMWDIRAGQPSKVSESWMEFKTRRPVGPDRRLDDFVEDPIIVRLQDFPFYLLIMDKHPERWPGGKRCVPGNMRTLEEPLPK